MTHGLRHFGFNNLSGCLFLLDHYKYYGEKTSISLNGYSARALRKIWRVESFSWWLTSLMHRFLDTEGFGQRVQEAELDYLMSSVAAHTTLAENYVGPAG